MSIISEVLNHSLIVAQLFVIGGLLSILVRKEIARIQQPENLAHVMRRLDSISLPFLVLFVVMVLAQLIMMSGFV